MIDLPVRLDSLKASRKLAETEMEAYAALLAVAAIVGDDFMDDEDWQPVEQEALYEMLKASGTEIREGNLQRVMGLLHAVSGDEYTDNPVHFMRITGAMVEGDPFVYEDDWDEATVADLFWGLYQAGLLVDEDLAEELSDRVKKLLHDIAENEAEDSEELQKALADGEATPEEMAPYAEKMLLFRRVRLAGDLVELGVKSEFVRDQDPALADTIDGIQSFSV